MHRSSDPFPQMRSKFCQILKFLMLRHKVVFCLGSSQLDGELGLGLRVGIDLIRSTELKEAA